MKDCALTTVRFVNANVHILYCRQPRQRATTLVSGRPHTKNRPFCINEREKDVEDKKNLAKVSEALFLSGVTDAFCSRGSATVSMAIISIFSFNVVSDSISPGILTSHRGQATQRVCTLYVMF